MTARKARAPRAQKVSSDSLLADTIERQEAVTDNSLRAVSVEMLFVLPMVFS